MAILKDAQRERSSIVNGTHSANHPHHPDSTN
jgi:hypothetical protein